MGFELSDDPSERKKQAVIVDAEMGMVECVVCTEFYPPEVLSKTGRCIDCRPGAHHRSEE